MSVKLIIYMVHNDKARAELHDKVMALGAHVYDLSGSAYALFTLKSADAITEALKPSKTPDGFLRFFVVEVTNQAAVSGYSTADSNGYLAWLKAKGQLTATSR